MLLIKGVFWPNFNEFKLICLFKSIKTNTYNTKKKILFMATLILESLIVISMGGLWHPSTATSNRCTEHIIGERRSQSMASGGGCTVSVSRRSWLTTPGR